MRVICSPYRNRSSSAAFKAVGELGQFNAVGRASLAQHVGYVDADRFLAQHERFGDVGVRAPGDEVGEDLAFAAGQARDARCVTGSLGYGCWGGEGDASAA